MGCIQSRYTEWRASCTHKCTRTHTHAHTHANTNRHTTQAQHTHNWTRTTLSYNPYFLPLQYLCTPSAIQACTILSINPPTHHAWSTTDTAQLPSYNYESTSPHILINKIEFSKVCNYHWTHPSLLPRPTLVFVGLGTIEAKLLQISVLATNFHSTPAEQGISTLCIRIKLYCGQFNSKA